MLHIADSVEPTDDKLSGTTWRKSSASSGHNANCVEMALTPSAMLIRDSKNHTGSTLSFPRDTWVSFLHSTRNVRNRT
jgi:hypothetical protein